MSRPVLLRLVLRAALIGALALLLAGLVSLVWTPHAVERANLEEQLQGPSAAYWLGTDAQGRDVLSLLMKGLLTSLVVAGVGSAIGLVFGGAIGLAAAIWRKAWPAMAPPAAALTAVPAVVVAVLLTTIGGPGSINAMAAIGFATAPAFALAVRDTAARLGARGYVRMAEHAGASRIDAWFRHVMPGLSQVVAGMLLLQLAVGVTLEAALSYTGLGAHPHTASLGVMLRDAQSYLLFEPLLVVVPGLVVVLLASALALAGMTLQAIAAREDLHGPA